MKLTISKNANPNYLAKIVEINTFSEHPNADKLKLANVDGCIIAVGIDTKPGMFVYFPVECCISQKYLHENNLYRINTMNHDLEATPGFFEEKGRVKCIKLRGFASEGLVMPFRTLLPSNVSEITFVDLIGTEFDTIDNELFVKKYVPKNTRTPGAPGSRQRNKEKKYEDLIIENQFRFHNDTEMLKKNMFKIDINDFIHISHKFHGTSAIFCNLLVKKELSIYQKFLKNLGANVITEEYKIFCSSRKVIKNPTLNKGLQQGYYNVDIWNIALEIMKDYLQKGMTIYAEIVGYLPNGTMIQKDYDYGCEYIPSVYDYNKMTPQQMYEKNLFKIYVYRITYTNVDGKVFEMSPKNLQQYCTNIGLIPVIEDYYGNIFRFMCNTSADYSNIDFTNRREWEKEFIKLLSDRYLEGQCKFCKNKVPAEGIVLRVDKPKLEAYKLKALAFYERETKMLDKGEIDIETEES